MKILIFACALGVLANTVLGIDCTTTCGGCKPGRCDVFGCTGGLYCCVGNVIDPNYGACCSSCSGSPPAPTPTSSPTPSPTPCPTGTYTPKDLFPWQHHAPCSKKTFPMKACEWAANKAFSTLFLGAACNYASTRYEAYCVEMAALELEETAMFGPEAIFGSIGLGLMCAAKGMAVKWVCGQISGKITQAALGSFEDRMCTSVLGFFSSRFSARSIDASTVQPTGFPPSCEVFSATYVNGTKTQTTRTAYDASQGIFFQFETLAMNLKNWTTKRYISKASTGSGGCAMMWNETVCKALNSEDSGINPASQTAALPTNYLDLILQRVFNLSQPLQFVGTDSNGVNTFVSSPGSAPSGFAVYYSEKPGTPLSIDIVDIDTNTSIRTLEFTLVQPYIDNSFWTLPSHCPYQVGSGGLCDITCQNMQWGRCYNMSYGIVSQNSTKYSSCGAALGYPTMCPTSYPYCTPGHSCSSTPIYCSSGSVSFTCGSDYPCCDFSSKQCRAGPCSASTPMGAVSPHVTGDSAPMPPPPPPDPCLKGSGTNCSYCMRQGSCGWCPSSNQCLSGSGSGPRSGVCVATLTAGTWTYSSSDCKCLTATNCSGISGTNCGWCPSTNRAYVGSSNGPGFGLSCQTTQQAGQWTWSPNNCKCLTATNCSGISGTDCGWCPSWNRAYLGSSNGPGINLTCPATQEAGQWTWNLNNCKCLTATTCTNISGTDCGWCPSLGKAYLGSSNGPGVNLTCPATQEAGSWTWNLNDCKCVAATTCSNITNTDCGWCPSTQKAYLGSSNGPVKNLTCPASATAGQWTWDAPDCAAFTATNCTSCMKCPDCGWCTSNSKCYLGSSNGPSGLTCAAGWIWGSSNCKSKLMKKTGDWGK
eukprot:PhF_6_TR37196/c0_g1_i1/m.54811